MHFTDAAPDITQFNNTRRGADRVTRYVNVSQTDAGDTGILLFAYDTKLLQKWFGLEIYFEFSF